MDTKTLFQLSADMAAIEDALWESGGELTEELALAMQETEAGLAKKADGYIALIRSFAAQKDILKAEEERYAKLRKVAENAEKRLKQHLCDTMGIFDMQKIEGDKGKITRVKSTSTETQDEVILAPYQAKMDELRESLPAYVKVPELKVDKTAIKELFKETGVLINGAAFVENFSVRIK